MSKTNIVSFSGGRTSAYLVYLMESMRKSGDIKDPVDYVFMDTSAEHPKTYEFIRKVVSHFKIQLTCLQGDFNQPVGQGHNYNIVSVGDIRHDPVNGVYGQMMRKYGVPTIANAWCTSRMKEETFKKYCDDKYGKDNYVTWLGIRIDERKRLHIGKRNNLRYMAEITDFEKRDVLSFWQSMPFNLEISEHLGNCVFCFKKTHAKIALAAREEKYLLNQWKKSIEQASDRLNKPKIKNGGLAGDYVQHIQKGVMYRNRKSIEDVIAMFSMFGTDDLKEHVYRNIDDSGTCSESCEAFGDLLSGI